MSLVLSRKEQETIRVGDDIEITVIKITRGRVQIGVKAPREIPVCRAEASSGRVQGQDDKTAA